MDIVVRGRHIELSDRFREQASGKLTKLERYDGKCQRIDVEVSKQANPRRADQAVQVELTAHGKGPVVRAEAAADEKYVAFDLAVAKLEERLRRAADRRHDRHRPRGKGGAVRAGSPAPDLLATTGEAEPDVPSGVADDGPMVVREKTHQTAPMSLDQALYEMELVGHDFYLFVDAATRQPSVVYRRRGYDYGVLHLDVSEQQE